jgi:hypothetical protein
MSEGQHRGAARHVQTPQHARRPVRHRACYPPLRMTTWAPSVVTTRTPASRVDGSSRWPLGRHGCASGCREACHVLSPAPLAP